MSSAIDEVLDDPELLNAIRKLNNALRAHLDNIPGDTVFEKLPHVFHDVNAVLGFMSALSSATVNVSDATLADAAKDGQKAGMMLFQLLTSIRYVSGKVRETDGAEGQKDVEKIARVCANALLDAPDLLEMLNDLKLVTHSDVAAAR